jgi:hypothetical protein
MGAKYLERIVLATGSLLLTAMVCVAQQERIESAKPSTVQNTDGQSYSQKTNQPQENPPQQAPTPAPQSATPAAEQSPTQTPASPGAGTSPGANAPGTATPSAPSRTKSAEELRKQKLEQSYRVMGVVPMFGTTSRHDATPLTSKEKFRVFARSAFDPVTFVVVGFQAGISQAENSFPEYGQGAEGFGKYYGAAFADNVDSGFFSNFFYPVLFKQDPRYFRLGEGSFKHRLAYSVVQEFVAHKDSGGRTFHFSNVLGALTSGSISNAYYPESDRGFGLTMSRSGIALLYGSVGGIFSEFWPDVQAKIFKHKDKPGLVLPTDTKSPAAPQPPASRPPTDPS